MNQHTNIFTTKIKQLPNESSLSHNNILRYRAENDFKQQFQRIAHDYETLRGADDQESIDIYISLLKRFVEGGLLAIAEYEIDKELKELYKQIAVILKHSNKHLRGNIEC